MSKPHPTALDGIAGYIVGYISWKNVRSQAQIPQAGKLPHYCLKTLKEMPSWALLWGAADATKTEHPAE